jgi:SlyX protein
MTTSMTPTDRLDALEMRIVHQDETIDDLNATVTEQWKVIDKLTREVKALTERLASANQAPPRDSREEAPPHY